ncbi:MAG: alpha-amylase family glycosyl hydrolase, partial [Nitrospirales bacterium]
MASTAFWQTHRPHPHLYEINTWAWLAELSDHLGKKLRLGDVPEQEWDRLQAKGFDLIWLMGLWERSPESRRIALTAPELLAAYDRALPGWRPDDVVGSPYAVRAYRPDPELATWAHVDTVRKKLHQRGMALVLDFVPNHTARDHDWVRTQPDWYILGSAVLAAQRPAEFVTIEHEGRSLHVAYGRDPYFPPWTDTAQLNHFNPDLRHALLTELRTIAQHCDGVRCDMAMLVLNDIFAKTWSGCLAPWSRPEREFWTEAVSALPDFLWLAEVYWDREWEMQQLGF